MVGCGLEGRQGEPSSLADLQIDDPDFTFSTNRTVQLELVASNPSGAPRSIEFTDAEGRRIMAGGFAGDVAMPIKVRSDAGNVLKLRVRGGEHVTETDVAIDGAGRASTTY